MDRSEVPGGVRFVLVDRILELEPGRRIVGQKGLSLAEEYLADHFPSFPVLPGVLMLEALVQVSAWLVREALDFAPSLVVLKEARNVTYKSFVAPGQSLRLVSECKELADETSTFLASGSVDGKEMLKARLVLRQMSLADQTPELASVDEAIRNEMRSRWRLLAPPPIVAACPTSTLVHESTQA